MFMFGDFLHSHRRQKWMLQSFCIIYGKGAFDSSAEKIEMVLYHIFGNKLLIKM